MSDSLLFIILYAHRLTLNNMQYISNVTFGRKQIMDSLFQASESAINSLAPSKNSAPAYMKTHITHPGSWPSQPYPNSTKHYRGMPKASKMEAMGIPNEQQHGRTDE